MRLQGARNAATKYIINDRHMETSTLRPSSAGWGVLQTPPPSGRRNKSNSNKFDSEPEQIRTETIARVGTNSDGDDSLDDLILIIRVLPVLGLVN